MRNRWMKTIMNSNVPQNLLKNMGYKRRKNRSMTYSLLGIAASAAAAFTFRNRMGGWRRFFQNSNMANGLTSPFRRPMTSNMTEFAKEFGAGIKGTGNAPLQKNNQSNEGNKELINQIAESAAKNDHGSEVDELSNKFIEKNSSH